jgi:hypothetical protein
VRALLLALALCLSPVARADVVDRVIYVVEDQVVLQSDVAFDKVIGPLDDSPSPFWDRPGIEPEQRVVDAAIIRELAGDISLYQPPDDAVRARVEAMRARFPDRASWSSFLEGWGLDEDGLRALIRRRMVVERYLARTLRADPNDRAAWWASCNALLTEVRPRMRIRYVPLGGSKAK